MPFALTFVASLVTAELVLPHPPGARRGRARPAAGGRRSGLRRRRRRARRASPVSWGFGAGRGRDPVLVVLVALRGSAFATDRRPWTTRRGAAGAAAGERRRAGRALAPAAPHRGHRRSWPSSSRWPCPSAASCPWPAPTARCACATTSPSPPSDDNHLNPLTRLAADAENDDVRYKVRLHDGGPASCGIRLVALDRYDGVKWTSGGRPTSAPARACRRRAEGRPPPPAGGLRDGGGRRRSTAWLPTLDRPAELAAPLDVDVRVDPAGASLLVPDGPRAPACATRPYRTWRRRTAAGISGPMSPPPTRPGRPWPRPTPCPPSWPRSATGSPGRASSPFMQAGPAPAVLREQPGRPRGPEVHRQPQGGPRVHHRARRQLRVARARPGRAPRDVRRRLRHAGLVPGPAHPRGRRLRPPHRPAGGRGHRAAGPGRDGLARGGASPATAGCPSTSCPASAPTTRRPWPS